MFGGREGESINKQENYLNLPQNGFFGRNFMIEID